MSGLARLIQLSMQTPERVALQDEQFQLSYRELLSTISEAAEWLRSHHIQRMALQLDNSISFILWDLAAQLADVVCIPLPLFFTNAQQLHVIHSAGIDLLLSPRHVVITESATHSALELPDSACLSLGLAARHIRVDNAPEVPVGTSKITFTSGTTGSPKGVCLSSYNQWHVAQSLQSVAATQAIQTHLCVLPLAVLLENVAGVYSALLNGARVVLPSLAHVGLHGSSQFDPEKLWQSICEYQANSVILLPQMLQSLLNYLSAQFVSTQTNPLRFVAVGGARVSPELLLRADALNIPVYEGYGLSECASVVAVNTPDARRAGTVGRPLPHVQIARAEDGELLVHGNAYLGYLGTGHTAEAAMQTVVATGDIGRMDCDGYLHIEGRKKNLLITSYGRNVSPEWPESELLAESEFLQVAVFGDSRPSLCAVIVPQKPLSRAACSAIIQRVNARLPDYARIGPFVLAMETFRPENGLLTSNGRPRRDAVWQRYADALEKQYHPSLTLADSHAEMPETFS